MNQRAGSHMEISLGRAAVIAGLALLVMSVLSPYAYFHLFPSLIDRASAAHTEQNIAAHQGLFLAGIVCYLGTFLCDIVVAWALYVFLRPVSASLSLLAAWLRLVYAAMGLSSLLKLVTVLRLVRIPDYRVAFGSGQLDAQVALLLDSYRYDWGFSLIPFAIHLCLLSYLVSRSGYVPRFLGVVLAVTGAAYMVDSLRPYLFPAAALPWLFALFFGELLFMAWLLIRGSRLSREAA